MHGCVTVERETERERGREEKERERERERGKIFKFYLSVQPACHSTVSTGVQKQRGEK